MSALFLLEKHTRRTRNLMLPTRAASRMSAGSPTPLNEPLCGCSPVGTIWQVLTSFNTSVSASSILTLAPPSCRWHGGQLPFCKGSLLLPRPFFQSLAYSALCFMPLILVGRLYICQGTGSSLLMPLGPSPCEHPGFALVAQLRCLTLPPPVK